MFHHRICRSRINSEIKAAWLLQGFATIFYAVFSVVVYVYIGSNVASPAMFWQQCEAAQAEARMSTDGMIDALLTHYSDRVRGSRQYALFDRSTHVVVLSSTTCMTLLIESSMRLRSAA